MKTCETCRFFGTGMGVSYWDDDKGDMVETEHRACARIIHGNGFQPERAPLKELAVVTDGSGYSARLQVLPTFGCVLHESKDEGDSPIGDS